MVTTVIIIKKYRMTSFLDIDAKIPSQYYQIQANMILKRLMCLDHAEFMSKM
jgi:hypothetical protein